MDANLAVLLGTTLILVAIPLVAARLLKDQQGRRLVMILAPLAYLLLGNLLSRVVLGDLIYDPDLAGADPFEQQRRFVLHTIASMGSAAVIILAAVAGLRRILPLQRRHYGAGS